jgi:hypothetical protein
MVIESILGASISAAIALAISLLAERTTVRHDIT